MSKPSLLDIRRAIDRSGYVLELRLAPKIEKAGFWVRNDSQFRDQDTGKSREIDLYANCRTQIATRDVKAGPITYVMPDSFETHLVVECKSLSTPLVFFSRENKLPIHGRLLFGGFPSLLWKRDRQAKEIVGELFELHIDFPLFHSYWSPRYLATRFGRLTSKKAGASVIEWELDHGPLRSSVRLHLRYTDGNSNRLDTSNLGKQIRSGSTRPTRSWLSLETSMSAACRRAVTRCEKQLLYTSTGH